jgi:integrase/recombinase XerC
MTKSATTKDEHTALVPTSDLSVAAIRNAVAVWSDATTNMASSRRHDIRRDKQNAVISFFSHAGKNLLDVTPLDVKSWQESMEAKALARTTVYYRLCHLSSFYSWAQKHPTIGQYVTSNPVRLAHPKAPKAYQTESVKALTDEEFVALLSAVRNRAATGEVVGKRDYALLLFYVATGMRRAEVINLRGREVELREDSMVIRSRVKGGDYLGREVSDPRVRKALMDYLTASGRVNVLSNDGPLWTRHDRAGKSGAPLTSHAFALNLKRYAREAGIGQMHMHQTRHTFARMVAEDSGSITETQDALGHKNIATTRVYVQRIAVRRDGHSERILGRLEKRN